ncbi:hypothetical protein ACP4OV_015296 [Aristida adscensionis]
MRTARPPCMHMHAQALTGSPWGADPPTIGKPLRASLPVGAHGRPASFPSHRAAPRPPDATPSASALAPALAPSSPPPPPLAMADRALPPLPPPPDPSTAFGSPVLPLPPGRAHNTYVVQVRKDQIYRIPPPENAYLAERYRAERAGAGKRGGGGGAPCSPCLLRTLGALLVAAILVAAAVAISVVVLRPDVPSFTVDRLSIRNTTTGREQRLAFDLFATAINPNKMTALWYRDGKARLVHRGTTLARGGVGEPAVGGEDATDFTMRLRGVPQRDGRTPKVVDRGLKGSKEHVALHLAVEASVQVHVGALGFGTKRLAVSCEIGAAGLREEVRITSQKCKSSFGN